MKLLLCITFLFAVHTSSFAQTKMRIIKNKIKQKVEVYDEIKEAEIEASKSNTSVQVVSSDYSEEQFLRDYKFDERGRNFVKYRWSR